ncbi:MAG: tetratricopeptide repeat protein, partial [Actinomycetota bacterium]|nr:tetratricopeptide repeat protein [Actinomycetota bacterium]
LRLSALGAALVLATGVAAAWAAFQPLRSAKATDVAYERLERGQARPAVDIARIAVERNRLSVDPLFELSAILTQTGRARDAERELERAVELQPANSETWRRLGEHRVLALNQPKRGLAPLRAAYYLDPESREIETAFVLLNRQLNPPPPPPPPPPSPPPPPG